LTARNQVGGLPAKRRDRALRGCEQFLRVRARFFLGRSILRGLGLRRLPRIRLRCRIATGPACATFAAIVLGMVHLSILAQCNAFVEPSRPAILRG
jgi:hypothetical protein